MSASTKVIQAAAGAGGGLPTGKYLAVSTNTLASYITLLDHTTPGSLSLAATYQTSYRPYLTPSAIGWNHDGTKLGLGMNIATFGFALLNHSSEGSLSFYDEIDVGSAGVGVAFAGETDYVGVANIDAPGKMTLVDTSTPASLSISQTYLTNINVENLCANDAGDYFIVGHNANSQLTVLDHSTPGTVAFASTYTMSFNTSVQGISFNHAGDYVTGTVFNNTPVTLLNFNDVSGALTLATTYTLQASQYGHGVSWVPDDSYVAIGSRQAGAGPNVTLLDHTTSGSLSLAATYTVSGSNARGVDFTPDGKYLAVNHDASPYLTLLDHTTPGSLSLAATYTLPSYNFAACKFSPT